MEDQERSHREARVHLASLYREMCQTGGFRDLKRELENRIADLKGKWISADDVEAAKIRIRASVYNEIFDLIKSKVLVGDMAARALQQDAEPVNPWSGQSQE